VFCSQCGASNADDAVKCMQCGKDLNAQMAAVPSAVITPGQPGATDVPNYLVPSILVTVLCCLFTGIPAIIYAAQVNNKLAVGDVAGARLASKNAKMWCWISAAVGVLTIGFYTLVVILGVAGRLHR
jgi:hypothetical protein